MSRKRRREVSSVDTRLVEIYDDLANENEDIRIKAAHALLTKLSSGTDCSHEQLIEVFYRLIRGLCSSRKAARVGFSIALTELLSQRSDQHQEIPELIDLLIKQTEAPGKAASGQEERDHQFGRLFGSEAFIKSGTLFEPGVSIDAWLKILDIIYGIAKQKQWLREECGWILFQACHTLKEGDHDHGFIEALLEKLCQNGMVKTPEGVAIWLNIRTSFPKVQLPGGVWRDENPLHRKEKVKLSKILKETSTSRPLDESSEQIAQKGNWSSKIHFAWSVVLGELASNMPRRTKSKTVEFEEFWREAIDDHLFAVSSSNERKYWGFSLFQQMCTNAPASLLPALFSPNFKRCLVNQLASKDRYLHRAAQKSIKTIFDRVGSEPSSASAALEGLSGMSQDGSLSFDQMTKTKTLERLVSLADDNSSLHFGNKLCNKFVHPDVQDDESASTRRLVIADEMCMLLKSRGANNVEIETTTSLKALVDQILGVWVTCSYFSSDASSTEQKDLPDPPISGKTRDMLRTRLLASLTHIVTKFAKPGSYVYRAVDAIRSKESDQRFQSCLDSTGSISGIMTQAWETLALAENHLEKGIANEAFLDAFILLYSLTILQVYNGDADAVSMLDELRSCYDSMTLRHQVHGEQGSEMLMEILLGLIAKPPVLFRRLAQQVFATATSDINSNGLRAMIKILETKENVAGREEMFEGGHEDSELASAASDTDSEVEEVDIEELNGVRSSPAAEDVSTSNESGEEPENIEGREAEDEELAAFDLKLAQALGTRPANGNVDALSDDESSDEDMDDEQMEALDEHITTIFKERKNVTSKKADKKNAKETIVTFKCRVFELLDIYIKQQHQDPLALDLLLPLLTVTRTTTSSLVSKKACNLVRAFGKGCKDKTIPRNDNTSKVIRLLEEVHVEARLEGSNAHAQACSQASLLLTRLLMAVGRENLRTVVQIYAATQEAQLLDARCRIKMLFFTEWLNWCNSARLAH